MTMPTMAVLHAADAERWIQDRMGSEIDREARDAVQPIIEEVRARGDAALREFTRRFDGVEVTEIEARRSDRRNALASLPPDRRRALEEAVANLYAFHRSQLREERAVEIRPGVTVSRVFRPIERVGIYVPGGRAGYPSSVLACGVPARLAGCRSLSLCVPPGLDGRAPESVLAAAELLEMDHIYVVGGAQAIAALAFGTESVPRVDKIVGPGNRYVTAAKELVYGSVAIDMPAGPSEVVVLADETAKPGWVAADLVSQAEHATDVLAACLTAHSGTAERVAREIDRRLEALPDPGVARASLERAAICVAPTLEVAIGWANLMAPEHLVVLTKDDEAVLGRIQHAGSVFLGPYAAVPAGDYATGSNHVLPTARRARAWGALSVDDFGRWMQVQRLTAEGLSTLSGTVSTLARWEGFEAHARAVEARFDERREET